MTTALVIGSEPNDIKNIKDTIDLLTDCYATGKSTSLSYDNLESLLDWYKGIYGLLSDFSSFVHQTEINS